jgi:hypothetical protein
MTILGPTGNTVAVVNPAGLDVAGLGTGNWEADVAAAGW